MPRQLGISTAQDVATDRHDLRGVVYVMSGVLPGRAAGVSDLTFRWATQTFSGALGDMEQMIQLPRDIARGHEFLPGTGATNLPIRVPVRNLPLGDSPSVLAAIDDGKYAWENATVSIRVGYLKPGQNPEDLAADDWTFLAENGFLGPPQDINTDGMVVPVYNRGAKRNQVFSVPPLPDVSIVGAMDKQWLGKSIPLLIGKPDGWLRLPTIDVGVRGFTVSGQDIGDTSITFQLITDGADRLSRSTLPSNSFFQNNEVHPGVALSGQVLMIHRRRPLYQIKGAETVYSVESGTVTVQLESGLAEGVPRGSFVQENKRYSADPNDSSVYYDNVYKWMLCGGWGFHNVSEIGNLWQADLVGNIGWLFPDGTVKLAEESLYQFKIGIRVDSVRSPLWNITILEMEQENPLTDPLAPTYYDPNSIGDVDVATQPQFSSTERADSIINYPTGGTGTDNALARDGNTNSAASIGVGSFINLTFNSAPSPFANDDTTISTLHVIVTGDINFENAAGSITFGQVSVDGTHRFTQGTPRNFNETLRCEGAGGSGGAVVEAWWEHSLSATVENTRTQDTILTTGGGLSGLGEVMEYAELVIRMPSTKGNVAGKVGNFAEAERVDVQWRVFDTEDQNSEVGGAVGSGGSSSSQFQNQYVIPTPTAVLATMASWFLGGVEGTEAQINSDVYQLAEARFLADDVRLNFYLYGDEFRSWSDVERAVAEQTRSHVYYGPRGHEVVYMETASGFTESGVVREFRMPGTPGANVAQQGTLMERQSLSEISNTIQMMFTRDYIVGRTTAELEVSDSASVALYGSRVDPRWAGGLNLWMHSRYEAHPSYEVSGVVSGIGRFYVDRSKFANTRFSFQAAWPAHIVERGSPVRVCYEVAPMAQDERDRFRCVTAEVEQIRVNPLNSETRQLVCRAVETPTRGLPDLLWVDAFEVVTDLWTSELDAPDTWASRWSI